LHCITRSCEGQLLLALLLLPLLLLLLALCISELAGDACQVLGHGDALLQTQTTAAGMCVFTYKPYTRCKNAFEMH
jgi:hypothetical protein